MALTTGTKDDDKKDGAGATGAAPTIEELQAQLAKAEQTAREATEAAQAAQEEKQSLAEQVTGLQGTVQTLETKKGELEDKLAAAPTKAATPAKVKKQTVLVVSATDYSYDIGDGIKVTPDVPVKAERYDGNLLDAQMKAGYIVEFEA